MSKRTDLAFLKDIVEAIKRIKLYTENMDYSSFLQDIKTQDAVLRNLEIIGEAVKNISYDFKEGQKDIEWKKIAGMRDKIIHFYFGVNWDIVWNVINDELLTLKENIEKLIDKSSNL